MCNSVKEWRGIYREGDACLSAELLAVGVKKKQQASVAGDNNNYLGTDATYTFQILKENNKITRVVDMRWNAGGTNVPTTQGTRRIGPSGGWA